MANSKIHPQFFHTLAHDFHTHLTIPEDFFIKYIEGTSVEKNIAEMKLDFKDKTWEVKLSGRSFGDGWEEFAVANSFETGDVVVVRYQGDMVFSVLDLGPNCSQIPQDITPLSNNSDAQDDIGKTLMKKRLYSTSQDEDGDDEDTMEIHRRKKAKKNDAETESCVVLVTASNLCTDTLCLPHHFTSSNGISRNCDRIVLKDEGERSWTLDLAFNISFDTFYISRGWKDFCDENGQTAGGFFMFRLVENGETPVLSFCPTESTDCTRQSDCSEASWRESPFSGYSSVKANLEGESSSMESLMDMKKKKCSLRHPPYSSYSPCHKQSITLTVPCDYAKIPRLTVPKPFLNDNGISKPCKMYLLGEDGKKWHTNLVQDNKGTMRMGAGWKEFVGANGLNMGESFTFKLTWEDTTPVLSLCPAESSIDRGAGGGCSMENQKESPPIQPCSCKKVSKDVINSYERGKNNLRGSDTIPSNQNKLATLKVAPSSFKKGRLVLPAQFARENNMNKRGMMIYLSSKDGTKWQTTLLRDKCGTMSLGKGWKGFAEANDLKSGDSFKVELIWEDATHVLRLVSTEANEKEPVSTEANEREPVSTEANEREPVSTEANEREPVSTEAKEREPVSTEANEREAVYTEPRSRETSPAIQNRFVTLLLTPEDLKACKLHLPSEFMKANGINKLGKITISGENRTEWSGYLLSRDGGTVALGIGWEEFCETNGVNLKESFTLESIHEQNATPLLKFCFL